MPIPFARGALAGALLAGAVVACDAPTAPSEAPPPEAPRVTDPVVAHRMDVLVDPWLGALIEAHADPLLRRAFRDAAAERSPATVDLLRSMALDRAAQDPDPDAGLAAAALTLALESPAPSR